MAASRIVVGYDGGSTGQDALAFAERWCRASGDELHVVTVHPGPAAAGVQRVDAEWVAYEREEADRLLEQARESVPDDLTARYHRVDAGSAAHGLSDLAEASDTLVVLGTRRQRGLRRTFPGSTAERLLHGSEAPVALVPWGYADTGTEPLRRVGVAYVDTPDAAVALDHAARMSRHLQGTLNVISVVPDTRVISGMGEPRLFGDAQRGQYQASLDAALAGLPDDLDAGSQLLDGPVVEALTELGPEQADFLVCGSRGYGPVRSVLLGGVSSRVVRHAKLPVVVVPRGA